MVMEDDGGVVEQSRGQGSFGIGGGQAFGQVKDQVGEQFVVPPLGTLDDADDKLYELPQAL